MEVEEGEMEEDDAPAPWYVNVMLKCVHDFQIKCQRLLVTVFVMMNSTFYFQFHPNWLQLVQKVLDAAGLLQKPCAMLW